VEATDPMRFVSSGRGRPIGAHCYAVGDGLESPDRGAEGEEGKEGGGGRRGGGDGEEEQNLVQVLGRQNRDQTSCAIQGRQRRQTTRMTIEKLTSMAPKKQKR